MRKSRFSFEYRYSAGLAGLPDVVSDGLFGQLPNLDSEPQA